MITLFHYVHCPFCIRVRMAFGFLKTSYKSEVLPYSDESTPLKLTGVKMLPIAKFDESSMNESLDIIKKADDLNLLLNNILDDQKLNEEVEDLLNQLAGPIHNLVMPYWIYTKEFNEESRNYFQKKKELKRGPFNELAKKKSQFLGELETLLPKVEVKLNPFYNGEDFTIIDIMIASHLWGLYMLPEFQFSPRLHLYLQTVKNLCHFEYHENFWSGELGE
ncbi:MAG: glutathione S-transferase N-terminal domain-containing protein [Bacteriovoracaceae bacterium]|nr:glutathione S-transferase N-terminal domain-containing protein [Bacteriovoracaceae bacterium]